MAQNEAAQPDTTRTSLAHLRALVEPDLRRVDALILEQVESDISLFPNWHAMLSPQAANACAPR